MSDAINGYSQLGGRVAALLHGSSGSGHLVSAGVLTSGLVLDNSISSGQVSAVPQSSVSADSASIMASFFRLKDKQTERSQIATLSAATTESRRLAGEAEKDKMSILLEWKLAANQAKSEMLEQVKADQAAARRAEARSKRIGKLREAFSYIGVALGAVVAVALAMTGVGAAAGAAMLVGVAGGLVMSANETVTRTSGENKGFLNKGGMIALSCIMAAAMLAAGIQAFSASASASAGAVSAGAAAGSAATGGAAASSSAATAATAAAAGARTTDMILKGTMAVSAATMAMDAITTIISSLAQIDAAELSKAATNRQADVTELEAAMLPVDATFESALAQFRFVQSAGIQMEANFQDMLKNLGDYFAELRIGG